jgi:VWFA-related protein
LAEGFLLLAAALAAVLPSRLVEGQGARATRPESRQASTQSSSFLLRSLTSVVLVDVRVRARSGAPVTDLSQKDFRVWEDGVPQAITSFSVEDVEKLDQAEAATSLPASIDLGKLPPTVTAESVLTDHRLIVLFFDLSSMQPDDLIRALRAARMFAQTKLTAADLVAVVTYTSSLRILQNFTNDRAALEKSIRGILVGEESSSLSSSGTVGEAGGTNANGEEIVTPDVSAAFTPDETEFNIFNTDEKLAAIESLSEMLRAVPGRKSVIHFSAGIERTGIENQAQLRATIEAANHSNVSLYTMDMRGLLALPPGGEAIAASPSGTAVYSGSAISSQFSSLHGNRETLASLSRDTGGRTFYDLNDFSPAFDEIQRENSCYYMLGYSPSNKKSDGRFRRIRVEVVRPGVKVEARPGYFAPKDFRQFTREDKEQQLQQAMDLDTPFVDLPLAVEAAYFRLKGGNYYVVLAGKVPGSAVSFLAKSTTHQTEFDFAWRATDAQGRPAGALRDTLPVKLTGEAYEQVLSGNILYEGGIVLPAGQYRLKVVARENRSGRIGTFEQPLDLPRSEASGLALSSVMVSNQLGRPEGPSARRNAPDNPLQVGDRSILPSVTRVFRTNQHLYIYLESYSEKATAKTAAAQAQSGNTAPPSVALVFFHGGVKTSEAGPFAGKWASRQDKAEHFVEIPLAEFPPGRYRMQVNVLDPARNQAAFARLPLAIMKPPARESAKSARTGEQ